MQLKFVQKEAKSIDCNKDPSLASFKEATNMPERHQIEASCNFLTLADSQPKCMITIYQEAYREAKIEHAKTMAIMNRSKYQYQHI